MSRGYSTDLRACVLAAIEGGLSKMAAHRTFGLSRSTIDHWITLREQTGSVAPRAVRRRRVRQLQGAAFEAFVERQAHATLDEMAQAWQQETGVRLSTMWFSRALRALKWTRKKELVLPGAR